MDHWLGASFHLDSSSARSRVGASISELKWADVKRVMVGPRSIRLSPLSQPSRLDSFRGVLLKTEPVNHSEVLEFVRRHCPADSVTETLSTETY